MNELIVRFRIFLKKEKVGGRIWRSKGFECDI